ncbi:MAG TPA: hypothetical protein VFU84_11890 [Gaiellaceae bacterium]|nr:hypothetical protein [Gaiellaceae bacterium]
MRATFAAAIVGFLCAGGAAQAQGDAKPRVRVLDPAPLTLRGLEFAPSESVRLVVRMGERTVVRKLRATPAGAFTSSYARLRYDRCSGSLEVTATGGRGSRVYWELVPLDCPTPDD